MEKRLLLGNRKREQGRILNGARHCAHPANQGMMIMSEKTGPAAAASQASAPGADHDYAAATDWIRQTAATVKTPSPQREQGPPDGEELVSALLPAVPAGHTTTIVAHQIRQTLSTPRPGPVKDAAPADHDTFQDADPYSARCPDCDNPTGVAAKARTLVGRWAE
jgi:hypothetical protein